MMSLKCFSDLMKRMCDEGCLRPRAQTFRGLSNVRKHKSSSGKCKSYVKSAVKVLQLQLIYRSKARKGAQTEKTHMTTHRWDFQGA